MYMERMLEVGVVENGYVVECRVPLKKEKKKSKNAEVVSEYYNSAEKKYIAKDEAELVKLINAIVPLLDKTKAYSSEALFDAAVKEAAGKM